jgi:hypothetical protein
MVLLLKTNKNLKSPLSTTGSWQHKIVATTPKSLNPRIMSLNNKENSPKIYHHIKLYKFKDKSDFHYYYLDSLQQAKK